MSIRDILTLHYGEAGRQRDYTSAEFKRVISGERTTGEDGEEVLSKAVRTITPGYGKNTVILVPMKSLSLDDFSFPFQNTSKIREALRLQAMPFTAAGELDIFPVILTKTGRGSNGIAWYVSPEELEIPNLSYSTGGTLKIWPAPLPFISQLEEFDGNGVTIWTDEENASSILWQKNIPVMYRWRKLIDANTENKEALWYDGYCKAMGLERGGTFIVNASAGDYDDEDFTEIVSDSVRICPWIADVNLSRSALEGARDLERTVRLLSRVSCWLLAAGAAILGAELLRYYQLQWQIQDIRTHSEDFYRKTFDPSRTGRISNPVLLARDRIASLTGTGEEAHPIDEVLADMGDVFEQTGSADITIDTVRYNSEGIDCTGIAPDMTTVLNFRRAWESRAQLAQVDNTQFVSGIGYRFDLRVRW